MGNDGAEREALDRGHRARSLEGFCVTASDIADLNVTAGTAAFLTLTDEESWWHTDHRTIYLVDHPGAGTVRGSYLITTSRTPIRTQQLFRGAISTFVEYWSGRQIKRAFDSMQSGGDLPGPAELLLFQAILGGAVMHGTDKVSVWRDRLGDMQINNRVRCRYFDQARQQIEIATGFSVAGELNSAILCAAEALAYTIDGCLAGHGYLISTPAYRYQRYRAMFAKLAANSQLLSPDDYWRLQTMRDLDCDDSEDWIRKAIGACLIIIAECDHPQSAGLLREITEKRLCMKHYRNPQGRIPFLHAQDEHAADTAAAIGRAAVAVVVNEAGQVLLHLRDDKPGVLHAGRWSVLGGRCDGQEDEETTVRRELFEEAGLIAGKIIPRWRIIDWEGRRHLLTVFIVPTAATISQMRLGEGQDLKFFDQADLPGLDLAPFVGPLLETFFDWRESIIAESETDMRLSVYG